MLSPPSCALPSLCLLQGRLAKGCAVHFTANPGTSLLARPTHQGHQAPLPPLGQRKVSEAPSLPVDLLTLSPEGWRTATLLWCWQVLATQERGGAAEGLFCHHQEGRKTERAGLGWPGRTAPTRPGTLGCHAPTPHQDEGARLFSADAVCHEPSRPVPPNKYAVRSFNCSALPGFIPGPE